MFLCPHAGLALNIIISDTLHILTAVYIVAKLTGPCAFHHVERDVFLYAYAVTTSHGMQAYIVHKCHGIACMINKVNKMVKA